MGLWSDSGRALTGLGDPEQVRVLTVTHGTLQALGVPPALGRWFVDAEHSPAVGLAAAVAMSRWLESFLFEVRPLDLPTYVGVLGVLLVAVTLAAYLPARRAAKLDPGETLRAG